MILQFIGYLTLIAFGIVVGVLFAVAFLNIAFDRVNEARAMVDNAPLDIEKAVADARRLGRNGTKRVAK